MVGPPIPAITAASASPAASGSSPSPCRQSIRVSSPARRAARLVFSTAAGLISVAIPCCQRPLVSASMTKYPWSDPTSASRVPLPASSKSMPSRSSTTPYPPRSFSGKKGGGPDAPFSIQEIL